MQAPPRHHAEGVLCVSEPNKLGRLGVASILRFQGPDRLVC